MIYDADCGVCLWLTRLLKRLDLRGNLTFQGNGAGDFAWNRSIDAIQLLADALGEAPLKIAANRRPDMAPQTDPQKHADDRQQGGNNGENGGIHGFLCDAVGRRDRASGAQMFPSCSR